METPQITTEQIPENALPSLVPEPNGAAPEVKKEEPKNDMTSDKFAALAKKDKLLSKKSQDVSQLETRAKDLMAKAEAENKRLDNIRKNATLNPLEAMKELGLSYEKVTEWILNKEKPTADTQFEVLRGELRELKELQAAKDKKQEDDAKTFAQKQGEQTINSYKDSIDQYVKSLPEEYDLLNYLDSKGLINAREIIFNAVEITNTNYGKIPTIKEACDGVQEYLTGELDGMLGVVKHFKNKVPQKEEVKTPDGATPTTTLSNSMSSGTTSRLPAQTEEERIQRAIQAMIATEK